MPVLRLALLIGLLTLTGCGAPLTTYMFEADKARVQALLDDPAALRRFFADTTVKTWDSKHGTQIEYHSADGRTWLVYPGNTRAVKGRWRVQTTESNPRFCYLYGRESYNPVTRQSGGRWECQPAILLLLSDEVVDGDVLRLRGRGTFPQAMPSGVNASITETMQAISLGPLNKPNKTDWRYTR